MKWMFAAVFAAIAIASAPGAEAKGCIKGAIVGGAAGHMAGHGKLGAAAGCVVGHHEANKPNPQQLERPGAFRSEVRPWPSKGMPPGRCLIFRLRCQSGFFDFADGRRVDDACREDGH